MVGDDVSLMGGSLTIGGSQFEIVNGTVSGAVGFQKSARDPLRSTGRTPSQATSRSPTGRSPSAPRFDELLIGVSGTSNLIGGIGTSLFTALRFRSRWRGRAPGDLEHRGRWLSRRDLRRDVHRRRLHEPAATSGRGTFGGTDYNFSETTGMLTVVPSRRPVAPRAWPGIAVVLRRRSARADPSRLDILPQSYARKSAQIRSTASRLDRRFHVIEPLSSSHDRHFGGSALPGRREHAVRPDLRRMWRLGRTGSPSTLTRPGTAGPSIRVWPDAALAGPCRPGSRDDPRRGSPPSPQQLLSLCHRDPKRENDYLTGNAVRARTPGPVGTFLLNKVLHRYPEGSSGQSVATHQLDRLADPDAALSASNAGGGSTSKHSTKELRTLV